MGDKPAKYWDHEQCRWVLCPTPADELVVPAQSAPAEDSTSVVKHAEGDVRSG